MMTYRVIVTARAKVDIREAVDWWRENRSAEQAQRWLEKIEKTLRSLSKSPERCPLAPEADLAEGGLRQLHYGVRRKTTHRIVFVIDDRDLVIFRVRHIARDDLKAEDLQ